jgi:hypothetical protein
MGNRNSGKIKYSDFNKWNTEEGQYWIGYILSDGHIVYNFEQGQYSVSIFSKEIEIIDKFKLFENRVKVYQSKQNQVYFAKIHSIDLCNYLINVLKIPVGNKSTTLNYPLTPNILRGYFDGDGHVRKDRNEFGFVTGSQVMANNITDYLNSLGVKVSLKQESEFCFRINGYNLENCEKFYNLIYCGTPFLERKYKRFVALLSNKYEKLGKNGEG